VVSAASPVAANAASEVEAAHEGDNNDEPLGDNYDSIDWRRLPDL
jgi:hypothetical protein